MYVLILLFILLLIYVLYRLWYVEFYRYMCLKSKKNIKYYDNLYSRKKRVDSKE